MLSEATEEKGRGKGRSFVALGPRPATSSCPRRALHKGSRKPHTLPGVLHGLGCESLTLAPPGLIAARGSLCGALQRELHSETLFNVSFSKFGLRRKSHTLEGAGAE